MCYQWTLHPNPCSTNSFTGEASMMQKENEGDEEKDYVGHQSS